MSIYVTHDQREALVMSDRIAVMMRIDGVGAISTSKSLRRFLVAS